jgi:hypothetical protein
LNTLRKWLYFFIYKSSSKDIYWEKIISSLVVLALFFIVVFYNNKRLARLKKKRDEFGRYTIGITKAEHNNVKGSMVVEYYYFFARLKLAGVTSTKNWLFDKPYTRGGRYYVQVDYTDPSNVEIFFDRPVPDSITEAPDNGWTYMPGYR